MWKWQTNKFVGQRSWKHSYTHMSAQRPHHCMLDHQMKGFCMHDQAWIKTTWFGGGHVWTRSVLFKPDCLSVTLSHRPCLFWIFHTDPDVQPYTHSAPGKHQHVCSDHTLSSPSAVPLGGVKFPPALKTCPVPKMPLAISGSNFNSITKLIGHWGGQDSRDRLEMLSTGLRVLVTGGGVGMVQGGCLWGRNWSDTLSDTREAQTSSWRPDAGAWLNLFYLKVAELSSSSAASFTMK